MLHFRMDMPFYFMALYGSIMILFVIFLRVFLKNKLPKFVLPLLWLLVLIRLVVPFSLSSPLSMPVPELDILTSDDGAVCVERNIVKTNVVSGAAEEVVEDVTTTNASETMEYSNDYSGFSSFNWQFALMMVIYIGIVVTTGILLYQKWGYFQKFRNSLLIEHNETINQILRSMNMGHVLVFTNDHIATPLVSGIINPRIYLPSGMDFKNIQILRHILTHETMHIRRKDNFIKAVMLLAICLHWYNPLVWFMSKCLSADIEDACDAAVLKDCATDERQNYANSLLAMAITGNRQTLLYSAFSKSEVERRIRSVLRYKKASALVLALSIIFIFSSTVAFATGVQAPFSNDFSSYCGHSNSKWAVEAFLTRDIALGENAGERADKAILNAMGNDKTGDPDMIRTQVVAALAKEFGVEEGAFKLAIDLSIDDKELQEEYEMYGIIKDKNGFYMFQDEPVRIYTDEMLGSVQTRDVGTVDIAVIRDRLGQITSITVFHQGDKVFDQRTKDREQNRETFTALQENITSVVENK